MNHQSLSPELTNAWLPNSDIINNANITSFMNELDIHDVKTFHRYTIEHSSDFWTRMLKKLNVKFQKQPNQICDLTAGVESPIWFRGAKMNIAESCFTAPENAIAIIEEDAKQNRRTLTFQELDQLVNRIANSLVKRGLKPADVIAIIMPMNANAIAIYLGIIKMGGVVVSIADSFSAQEIALRLKMANAKAVFTQTSIERGGKQFPLYEKILQAKADNIIVVPSQDNEDEIWNHFLSPLTTFNAHPHDPMSATHILFSSGTTAQPKAIIWNHTTPIKSASDAYFHQNIKANDILCWPTNLGWMMGPWLLYSAFMNHAAIALYTDVPTDRAFGEFVARNKVTMLGVVPTLVAKWRQTACMEQLDWQAIKLFSSSGECSNPDDMFYLMSLANHKPIIEYCGGTEIGGGYVSSTVVEANFPSLFSTPTMGSNFIIIDEKGEPTTLGEVALIPPALGLSTELLNANHHDTYYAAMPSLSNGKVLRRHGDQIKQLANGYYMLLGRTDDTMNLGGIKTSAAEIERALVGIPDISEVAAVALDPPNHGPSLLVIYAATTVQLEKSEILKIMQQKIKSELNPLFKIHDVIFVSDLPKTASNKIMRRKLREN